MSKPSAESALVAIRRFAGAVRPDSLVLGGVVPSRDGRLAAAFAGAFGWVESG